MINLGAKPQNGIRICFEKLGVMMVQKKCVSQWLKKYETYDIVVNCTVQVWDVKL